MTDHYYNAKDLGRFSEIGQEAGPLWQKFSTWYSAVFADGALSEREKALIALGVAHAVQCPYCIDAFTESCLEKGADAEQMTEAVHVAAAIRGGASLVHGVQMRNKVNQLGM
jgi:alkylhydroperoxidase/carboxymuconolactone decarboxylase family protein